MLPVTAAKGIAKCLCVALLPLVAACGVAAADEPRGGSETSAAEALSGSYESWDAFAKDHGLPAHHGRARVVGVRGRDTDGNVHSTTISRGIFDDMLVVLTTDGRAVKLAVSTHPWERVSSSSPDVDRDGKGDVGMLLPGTYQAIARGSESNIAGLPTWHVVNVSGADGLPGVRNTEHGESYTQDEFDASASRKDRLTSILFHKGGDGAPNAIGCQVLEADGIAQLKELAGDRFDYLLVDANDDSTP
jgi:hypothetical protein